MLRYLTNLSACLFYLIGGSFFLCYLLVRNEIGGAMPVTWLRIGDLPLLLAGLIYGGLCVYQSIRSSDAPLSKTLGMTIGLPAAIIFFLFVILNFWPIA